MPGGRGHMRVRGGRTAVHWQEGKGLRQQAQTKINKCTCAHYSTGEREIKWKL